MRGPGADFRVTACTVQGMARVRSGQAVSLLLAVFVVARAINILPG
jgi:hypothetical protein